MVRPGGIKIRRRQGPETTAEYRVVLAWAGSARTTAIKSAAEEGADQNTWAGALRSLPIVVIHSCDSAESVAHRKGEVP